jgi:hypothetical protein
MRVLLAATLLLPLPGHSAETGCRPVTVELLTPHAGVMLGEVHGTREAPAFLERVVCSIAVTGRSVVLALEYPHREQSAVDAFLDNRDVDASAAEAALLRTGFWSAVPGDGRESQAWLTVLHDVRAWQRQKLPITVVAYDQESTTQRPTTPEQGQEHGEAVNAEFLSSVLQKEQGRAFVVIYSGNVHAMKSKGVPGLPGYESLEPTGYLLRNWDLLHLNMATTGGMAWFCSSEADCGPHWTLSRTVPPEPGTIRLGYPTAAFDGVYGVGPITASPPARQGGAARELLRDR